MPRSSRHKSSKHKDAKERDYSDSEKETSLKERKSKDESSSRVLKESASGEKRKLDSKESKDAVVGVSGNGEHLEGYSSSSKRRKERTDDGANDRWNGGEDGKGEVSRKSKEKLSESKSKRRDESSKREENVRNIGESEEVGRRSSGKSEGKHKDSNSRKDGADRDRERERDRDRKGREARSEKLVDGEEHRSGKQVCGKTESESIQEKRTRRKRDGSGDGDKYQDDVRDNRDRDGNKDGRPKDERYREKYREEKHRERSVRDRISSRSDDKQARDEPDSAGTRIKKSKPRENEVDRDRDSDFDRDFEHDLDRDLDHERGRDNDRYFERDHDRELDINRDNDRELDWDYERGRDRDRDHERDRDRERDYDSLYTDDRRDRNKDSRSRKRSPDDLDDDIKSRTAKGSYTDVEKKPSSISRVEADADRGRSQSRQSHSENFTGSRRRDSPVTSPQGVADEYRHGKAEDLRYRDAGSEHRPKTNSSRGGSVFPGGSGRPSRLRTTDKSMKTVDGHMIDLSLERSNSIVSPMGVAERSPSSSIDRRYMGRNNVRRSLEIEDSGRRNSGSIAARDLPSGEERSTREMPLEKDDSSLNDSSFYNRSNQTNSVLSHPPPSMRGGVGSPSFMGSFDEDGRVNTAGRYKRSGDHNLGRGQVNAWRGAPNWSSPLPNGFLPFPHGPPHGGFQALIPQFPSPQIFGVRPSMEISHPYHITEADRFSGHLRPPLGWQNMMDRSGSSHMHGWDGSNGIFRDESHMFGGPEWNQNRHAMNGHGWDSSSDMWKGQNGDMATDLASKSLKEEKNQAPADDSLALQAGQKQNEALNDDPKTKLVESKPVIASTAKGSSVSHPRSAHQRTLDPAKVSKEERFANFCNAYLSKVDISSELASSDLYSRCMGLMKVEVNTSINVDADVLINLKDGARAVPKNSSVFFSSALVPAPSDSIFKKAMDIYKKQRASGLPCVNGGKLDVIQPDDLKEQSKDMEETEKPDSELDTEMLDAPVTNADTEIPDAPVANVEEAVADNVSSFDKLEDEIVETHTDTEKDVPAHAPIPSPVSLDLVVEAPPNINEDKKELEGSSTAIKADEERSSDHAIPEDIVGDESGPFSEVPAQSSSPLPSDGQEVVAKLNSSDSPAGNVEEKAEEEGGVSGCVIVGEDGDGKGNEVLMMAEDTSKSESVMLSRIHDSPESTH